MALRTPLYDTHAALGATFTEFAGYDMPVVYGSIKEEHAAVRESVGLFDVSHMSNLFVEGPGAAETIAACTTKPADLEERKGRYTVLLNDDGTILDDLFYFHLGPDRFLVIPNAGMNQAAAARLQAFAPDTVTVRDESSQWAILALQGPVARDVLAKASEDEAPKFHRIADMTIGGAKCLVSGTGYTGEKGVEIYCQASDAPAVWDALMAAGAQHGIRPIGLGARDTLRLEKGYCLAGNEFAGGRTPLEAGLGWIMDWDHEFPGKAELLAQKGTAHPKLVALVQEKGVPRHGYEILRDGAVIGEITSGTQSPTLGSGIALGYATGVRIGDEVDIQVRNRVQKATATKLPFV
ncbi:MAG: glycine cleavage system aminomethyltransferase GcvT [Thermoplasmatota archaeon]